MPEEYVLYEPYRKLIGTFFSLKLDITKCLRINPESLFFSVNIPRVESFLVLARHAIDYERVILPFLNDPNIILLADRDIDTFYCYQSLKFLKIQPNLTKREILEQMRKIVLTWFIEPELTFYLKIPAIEAINRLEKKKEIISQSYDFEIIEESIKMYDFLSKYLNNRIVTIDATQSKDKITRDIMTIIIQYLNKKHKG